VDADDNLSEYCQEKVPPEMVHELALIILQFFVFIIVS
jgi:hypothetical protein